MHDDVESGSDRAVFTSHLCALGGQRAAKAKLVHLGSYSSYQFQASNTTHKIQFYAFTMIVWTWLRMKVVIVPFGEPLFDAEGEDTPEPGALVGCKLLKCTVR